MKIHLQFSSSKQRLVMTVVGQSPTSEDRPGEYPVLATVSSDDQLLLCGEIGNNLHGMVYIFITNPWTSLSHF